MNVCDRFEQRNVLSRSALQSLAATLMRTPPKTTVVSASSTGTSGNSSSSLAQYLVRSRSCTMRVARSCPGAWVIGTYKRLYSE